MEIENIIIIGSGPAGYSAAVYAARESFNPLMISGFNKGGQLMLTSIVDNYPGFPDGIDGQQLMELFRKQAERFGTRFIDDNVTRVDFSSSPYAVYVNDTKYLSRSVIIATGASSKWLGIDSEKRLIGKGVSSCATCDAPFFKGKDVVVVGGGDTAMEDSLFLTKFAKSVTLVHRREEFRASKIMQAKVRENPKIRIILNATVDEVLGLNEVSGVKIRDVKNGQESELKADGLFVAIGHYPNTDFVKGALSLDEKGYINTIEEVKTKIPGIFAAGDVVDHVYKQAATAAASGVKAALEARTYLNENE